MKKLYLFSCFDLFKEDHHTQNEFLEKHLKIYDVLNIENENRYFLTFKYHDLKNHHLIKKYNITTIECTGIDDFPIEKDSIYFTFGNFVDFKLNYDYYINKTINKNNITGFFNNNFLKVYEKLNRLINKFDIKVYQFMSDPMDLRYDSSIILTPDSKCNEDLGIYFPLYQYSHSHIDKATNKTVKMIIGSTCYDDFRKEQFNKYLLPVYEEYKSDNKYKFFISSYRNCFYSIDNFVEHNKFFDEISNSEFGIVLKTYSRDIISANKISQYLSRDCIPLLVDGCDKKSNLIPKNLIKKYSFNNGRDLIKKLQLNYQESLVDWREFKFDLLNGDENVRIMKQTINI